MVYISKKTRTVEQSFKKIVSFVTLDLIKRKEYYYERIKCFSEKHFLGGAAVGAAIGILFAPEKEDTRQKIAEILRKKGIRLNRNEMENLVDEITAKSKAKQTNKSNHISKQSHYVCRRQQY